MTCHASIAFHTESTLKCVNLLRNGRFTNCYSVRIDPLDSFTI